MTQASDIVAGARSDQKTNMQAIVDALFTDFFACHGDQISGDDPAIIAGLATLKEHPVAVIATEKGMTLEERLATHFGSPEPAGYRKALRVMRMAERLQVPIVTLINTPGAYPGADAEAAGQGQMIAKNIREMLTLKTPILTIIVGEAGSGGALALACSDTIWMLENSMYSILSPEGFASIMWKDAHRADEAAELMRLTPEQLKEQQVIDQVFPDDVVLDDTFQQTMADELTRLADQTTSTLLTKRQAGFRKF
ncbi:acetyl-CoA carboxylase carboxyl transferase subunit alpha [Secundilactobacillus paracollinoides]|uniref:acetyl-CoA carboxytransferase n=1 Tax=Secundilactobacillus paracollinoides TaxID=240427 RepID=A0A1B2J184_9LACO|nr:carboxyltransferase subunit alpha [Secundilactobacillus paracollinoides]ANZ62147.1 acetyl-CoA carboxylase carboxyl transferase subunit alpha [Secundilactobacillus paracollinoides]ANZ63836.1 acetyl-CoA carboxylase carboxyl transferase subunit alpha [Secundilactobacillus paracollinoides]ANZ68094.1 acetyl-CoA carboxylase carboxyl transferase subunit alpha [Secundilactobacillus paracollinoides]KRL76429.1 accA protein [Secundilactobacillus paracollinoides DSM 15502 = JCM 11969]